MPSSMGSSKLQGIASETANSPLIAITSISESPQQVQASCLGSSSNASFELAAGATAVLRACSWEQLKDADLNLIGTLQNGPQQSMVRSEGVSITSNSVPGSFYAFGFALNGSPARAQLQPVDFYDPGMLPSAKIVYVGVPVGAAELIQGGIYVPAVTLANFSSKARTSTIRHADSSLGTPTRM